MLRKQTKPTTSTAPSLNNANKRHFKYSVCTARCGQGVACYLQHFISRKSFVSFSLQTINSFSAVKTAIFKATLYVREAIIVKGMQHCCGDIFVFRNLAHRKIQHLSSYFRFFAQNSSYFFIIFTGNWDYVVSIETRLRDRWSGVQIPAGAKIFLFSETSRLTLGYYR